MLIALKTALRARLIAAGVNGGAALYDGLAPAEAPLPYVILRYQGGGDEGREALTTLNLLWLAKAVSPSAHTATQLADEIRTALHRQPLTLTGWRHLSTEQVESIWLAEASPFFMRGASIACVCTRPKKSLGAACHKGAPNDWLKLKVYFVFI